MKFIQLSDEDMIKRGLEHLQNVDAKEYEESISELREYVEEYDGDIPEWVESLNTRRLTEKFSVDLSPADLGDGLIVDKFEMVVSSRFTIGDMVYLSDGTHAFSTEKLLKSLYTVSKEILGEIEGSSP